MSENIHLLFPIYSIKVNGHVWFKQKESVLLKLIKSIFKRFTGNHSSNNLLKNNTFDTKKCMNCHRWIELDWINCPYCGYFRFHFVGG